MMKLRYTYIFLILIVFSCKKQDLATVKTAIDGTSTLNSIRAKGKIINDGGCAIQSKGICLSSKDLPSILDTVYFDSSSKLEFKNEFENLVPGKIYYVRSFCINKVGIAYGEVKKVSTLSLILSLPKVTTNSVTGISNISRTCGGNITSDGGATVSARGVCWSTTINPTLANNKTNNGSGIGSFSSSITHLNLNTTYYVRAYATNLFGTAYGENVKFNTSINIGDTYGGGIVAYILQSGDQGYIFGQNHGIIAATSDQSSGIQWYNGTNTTTNASGTIIGTGNSNTNTIVSVQGVGSYAAKLCSDLVLGGYTDWYLPSKDELNKLYLSRSIIGGFNSTDLSYYWSSSEYSNTYSIVLQFSTGNFYYAPKGGATGTWLVRAIRSF